MKIEVGKYYKTRHGSKVRVYTNDAYGDYCVHGAILIKGEVGGEYWRVECWTADGVYRKNNTSDLDLISEWTKPLDFDPSCLPAWAYWIAMNEDGHWFWHQLKPTPTSDESKHIWAASGGGMNGGIHYNFIPKNFTGDWTESLFSVNELKNDQP